MGRYQRRFDIVSDKLLNWRRNVLPKIGWWRQSCFLLGFGSCTHAGSRRIILAFLFSGEYPDHQATTALLISELYHWCFSHFVQIAREKMTWPFSGWALWSYLTILVQGPTNNSNNCNDLISSFRSKWIFAPQRIKTITQEGKVIK